MRDVFTCNTAGVERTHRELCTRLTDRLCCDDADGFTDFNTAVRCKRTSVAACAGAELRITGENRTNLELLDAVSNELINETIRDVVIAMSNDFTGRRNCVFSKLA